MKLKKVVLATACAAVLVVGSVAGTMAYLTSQDEVTNTFTVGNVAITLDEAKVNAAGEALDAKDNVVEEVADAARTDKNSYKLLPGHKYIKDPTVTVVEGSEESFVRMLVTVNEKADLDAIGVNLLEVFGEYDPTVWEYVGNTIVEDTRVYEFRYFETVDGADGKLAPLFTSITVPGDIDNAELESIDGLTIDVVAQAIQADGFDGDDDKAWAKF